MTEDALFEEYQNARRSGSDGQQALAGLYPVLRQHVESIIWLKLHVFDPPLAASIANEILLEIETFRGDAKFSTWVYAIARNHIYDELQRRKREVPLQDGDIEAVSAADVAMSAPHNRIFLQEILASLSADEQELVLGRLHGETHEEIAKRMGLNATCVRTRWEELTKKLRREYSDAFYK